MATTTTNDTRIMTLKQWLDALMTRLEGEPSLLDLPVVIASGGGDVEMAELVQGPLQRALVPHPLLANSLLEVALLNGDNHG